MKKIIGFIVILGLFSTQLFAGAQYSLNSAREQITKNNVNVSIAYEQYVLVKEQAKTKSLQLLPTLSVDMLIYDYQYAVLRSVIPEPSRFFEAAAQKDLAEAANINRSIVKNNLYEDLESTLFLFQFHKEMVDSFNRESQITNEIASRSKEAYDLGAIDFSDFYNAQRKVITAKTQKVNGNEIVKTEEFALKLILQVKDNTEQLNIDHLNFYNESLNFPSTASEAATIAVNNSKEISQFDYLISAASKQKKGVSVSWISWSGVGFDYFSRVRIASDEVTKIELNKKKAIYELENQVQAQYAQIESQKEKMSYQAELLAMAQSEYNVAKASESSLLNSFVNTKKAELSLISADRENTKLKYELELKYIKLKRLLGTNMLTNEVPRS